jgi:hypothetical protein
MDAARASRKHGPCSAKQHGERRIERTRRAVAAGYCAPSTGRALTRYSYSRLGYLLLVTVPAA